MAERRLCPLDELTPGSVRRYDVDGYKLAVVRCGDDLHVVGDTCSHAEVSLSEGDVLCDDGEIECWKHGSTFSLKTGEPSSLPATVPVPVFEAWVDDGYVMVSAGSGVGV